MAIEVITKEDFEQFKTSLLNDLKQMMESTTSASPVKPWLKNSEVMKLLQVSANTLQRLRIAGKLKSSKVGNAHYYRYHDVRRILVWRILCQPSHGPTTSPILRPIRLYYRAISHTRCLQAARLALVCV